MDHSGHGMDGMNMDLPPFTLGRGLEFGGDPVFLVGCLLGLGLYGWAVIRLRRRGDAWPVGRSVAWALGVVSVALVMCTGLNDYGMAMFSVHMVQHMIISMLSPILLLLGAPMTLALRALKPPGAAARGRANCWWRCCTAAICGSSRTRRSPSRCSSRASTRCTSRRCSTS